jgi:hypothetical protein
LLCLTWRTSLSLFCPRKEVATSDDEVEHQIKEEGKQTASARDGRQSGDEAESRRAIARAR